MTFYPLALSFSFVKDDIMYGTGIASFYIKYHDYCYLLLLGHKAKEDLTNKQIWFHHSRIFNQDISETTAYDIHYLDCFDTSKGIFLRRENILGLMDFQDQSLEVNTPELGCATLLTTIDGFKPKNYSCVINSLDLEKYDFRICINDPELIGKSGAGMSGSIVIQNRRIVGVLAGGYGNQSNYGLCISINTIIKRLILLDTMFRTKNALKRVLKQIK